VPAELAAEHQAQVQEAAQAGVEPLRRLLLRQRRGQVHLSKATHPYSLALPGTA
jgi:hypothetical protein